MKDHQKFSFNLHCTMCQKERKTTFFVDPTLPGEEFLLSCGCGNLKRIDDQEIVWIANTLKATTIDY